MWYIRICYISMLRIVVKLYKFRNNVNLSKWLVESQKKHLRTNWVLGYFKCILNEFARFKFIIPIESIFVYHVPVNVWENKNISLFIFIDFGMSVRNTDKVQNVYFNIIFKNSLIHLRVENVIDWIRILYFYYLLIFSLFNGLK